MNFRKYVLAGKSAEVMRYIYYSFERSLANIQRVSNETGVEYIDGDLLFNLAGYSVRSHACLPCELSKSKAGLAIAKYLY
jgi:hypothetical protein